MRNILAHEYFTRESEIIWETLKARLPEWQHSAVPNSRASAGADPRNSASPALWQRAKSR